MGWASGNVIHTSISGKLGKSILGVWSAPCKGFPVLYPKIESPSQDVKLFPLKS